MSKNVRATGGAANKKKTDKRVLRTRSRLGKALVELVHEKPFDEITVQELLHRAEVGRSTFYLHYRDKDDLFLAGAEEFMEKVAGALSARNEKSDRVAPVHEFFAHVGEEQQFYRALVASGRIDAFNELARGHFARGIEWRLRHNLRFRPMKNDQWKAISHAYAGALLSLLKWWIDTGRKQTPEEMDRIFHQVVWNEADR